MCKHIFDAIAYFQSGYVNFLVAQIEEFYVHQTITFITFVAETMQRSLVSYVNILYSGKIQ